MHCGVMYTKLTLLSMFAIFVASHPLKVIGGRAKPAIRRANLSTSTTSSISSTFSPLPPSGVVGLWGYRRFHANDSLIGRLVPCTSDEKICFSYNKLFDPKTGRCQPLGGGHPPGCELRPNRTEYERGSGHIYGVCKKYQDPCLGYRMAYDGRCYRKQIVRDVICGCGAEPTRHFLGGVECRCSPTPPTPVEQPTRTGRCYVPDLRFPADLSSKFKATADSRRAPAPPAAPAIPPKAETSPPSCSTEQTKCFAAGQVWVARGRACFPLLQRGPCAEDEVVVLSRVAWARQSAVCRHQDGGCPPGQRRMAFDSQCHDAREMQLAAPGRIALDIFGEYEVMNFTEARSHRPGIHNGTCVVFSASSMTLMPHPEKFPEPPCAKGNEDMCYLHDVPSDLPAPEKDYNYIDNGIS